MGNLVSKPILFKFKKDQRVYVKGSTSGCKKGTVDSRIPCEPNPMYYVNLIDGTRELFADKDLSPREGIPIRK